ncbi:glycosyltransferase involved in cell wall biosynthesis [Rhodopirellula rubra]|uniref:Glycosyltransferase involved in cell wall biosynthesis n=1 Tax=Aporhodopirellula rubra TaxID=980271 RepID=A0A7W5DXE8_9BACT|nr:glycosyltransferase family 4 protein [Aporhodopirellula rubra]MBB3206298.1 glycosyltransferase involved in cell wall biosynthesis [Aporhodopirellula rubra]
MNSHFSESQEHAVQLSGRRIVVTCHAWYDDLIGGSFRLASEFAIHLSEQGHQVTYVCSQPTADSTLPEREQFRGVDVARYRPPVRGGSGLARMREHLRQTRKLVERLNSETPLDAISGHSPLQGLGAAQAVRTRNAATKNNQYVYINYTVHSPFDDELLSNAGEGGSGIRHRIAATIARRIDRKNVLLADRVQTASQYTQKRFTDKFGRMMASRGIVAPGWVDAERFLPVEDRRALRGKLGDDWDCDAPVFFTLRRLQQRMGLDTLIDACATLHQQGHRFRMLIGGGGPLRNSLQDRIDRNGLRSTIRLLGRLDEPVLPNVYAAADCFVLPTRALECFGLIVLEALACNTPVIGSDVAAIPELVNQQGEQWLFPPDDVEALADRMRKFLTGALAPDQDLRRIAMQYDRQRILRQWERLLLSPESQKTGQANAS